MRLLIFSSAALLCSLAAVFAAPASDVTSGSAEALTTLQRAGQKVICSYPGQLVPAETLDAVTQGLCGGIIFFGENLNQSDPSVLLTAVAQLKQANAEGLNAGRALFLSTDQEGGVVRRLPGGPFQNAKQVGHSRNVSAAAASSGQEAAAALKAYGLNLNLAPVLGVYRTPNDFLDEFGRSYSQNASVVSTAAAAFISGQRSSGVLSSAKHFPGLGAAGSKNTDEEPVTISVPLSELRSIDEAPYKAAIHQAEVELVMPSWALYPSLDAAFPAGLSRTIIQRELRARHGFAGVTVSDAIEAGALRDFGSHEQRARLAADAGMDLILAAARNASQGPSVARALAGAYDSGTLNRTEFDASIVRIEKLRSTLPL